MPTDKKGTGTPFPYDTSYTEDRELSWLRFNRRVLEEAADERVPLWERFKFLAIFTDNLDEFFMVRVGSLTDRHLLSPERVDDKTGHTPAEQLKQIFAAVTPLLRLRDTLYHEVMCALRKEGVACLSPHELSAEERAYLNDYFRDAIRPLLSPQIVDSKHPFPHLANKALHVAALLADKKGRKSLGLISMPDALPDILPIPDSRGRYIRTEHVLLAHTEAVFSAYQVESKQVIAVTRNADLRFEEEPLADEEGDYRLFLSDALKKRTRLAPVRLELQGRPHPELKKLLRKHLGLSASQMFFCDCPLTLSDAYSAERLLTPAKREILTYPPFVPRYPACFSRDIPLRQQIDAQDKLVLYPFESIEPFLQLLREAADDPEAVSVKITLYRLAPGSKIAELLCRAAGNGKDVTVLIELRARFDEANNIAWAEQLEQAGCRILYGMDGLKCHSKLCLITYRDARGIHTITQIGTGNYNETTACLYTDLCLFTARADIGRDATAFFQNMLVASTNGAYERLLVAPGSMKRWLLTRIDREAEKGANGRIVIKANALTERDVIDHLAAASQAGVRVHLLLRGICCLHPGIAGKTEHITVTGIVGRFLEHSRIYCFGEGADCDLYLSSADLMTRNLDHRVEVACPILDPAIKEQTLQLLDILRRDNQKARVLLPDGTYQMPETDGPDFDSQQWLSEHSLQPDIPNRRSIYIRFDLMV